MESCTHAIFSPLGILPNRVSDCRPEWVCIVIESKCNEFSDQSSIESLPLWYSPLWLLPFSRQLREVLDWNVCADRCKCCDFPPGRDLNPDRIQAKVKAMSTSQQLLKKKKQQPSILLGPNEAWELVSRVKTPRAQNLRMLELGSSDSQSRLFIMQSLRGKEVKMACQLSHN